MTDDISKALRDSVDWLIANHIPYSTSRLTAAAHAFDTLTADLAQVTTELAEARSERQREHDLRVKIAGDLEGTLEAFRRSDDKRAAADIISNAKESAPAKCETHGHLWNSQAVCIFCGEPKPFRCPHGWEPWSACKICSPSEPDSAVLREDKERQQAARADTATSNRTGETGWLIEIAYGRSPMWWAASPDPRALGGFDPDSLKATRFAREKDAKDMATFLHVKGAIAFADISNIRITEHAWSDNPLRTASPPSTPNDKENGA